MPSKKIIGFDLDGTLIDSMYVHIDAFIYASKKFKFKVQKENVLRLFSNSADVMLKKLVPPIDQKTINNFLTISHRYFLRHIKKIKPFPGVIKTLDKLKKIYEIILISNTDYKNILRSLEAANLNPFFFDLIVSYDLVKHPKPYTDEIFLAEKILHHNLYYYVGDSIVDMKVGLKAKVKTIGVTTGLNTREELQKYKPYAIINKISELSKLLK